MNLPTARVVFPDGSERPVLLHELLDDTLAVPECSLISGIANRAAWMPQVPEEHRTTVAVEVASALARLGQGFFLNQSSWKTEVRSNDYTAPALQVAAAVALRKNPECVAEFVKGALSDFSDAGWATPTQMLAAAVSQREVGRNALLVFDALLQAGADPNAPSLHSGLTCLQATAKLPTNECWLRLEPKTWTDHGADWLARSSDEKSAARLWVERCNAADDEGRFNETQGIGNEDYGDPLVRTNTWAVLAELIQHLSAHPASGLKGRREAAAFFADVREFTKTAKPNWAGFGLNEHELRAVCDAHAFEGSVPVVERAHRSCRI